MTIQQDGKQMAELHDGNSFGEISLIDNTTRNAGIINSYYHNSYKYYYFEVMHRLDRLCDTKIVERL